jgi:predicted PurR-regulated permease PerM
MRAEPAALEPSGRTLLLPIVSFLALVAVLAFLVFRYFILDFVVAASIGLLMAPLQRRLAAALRGRAGVAAGLLVVLTTAILFVPVLSSLLVLGNQAGAFLSWLGPRLAPSELQRLLEAALAQYPLLATWIDVTRSGDASLPTDALQRLASGANSLIQATIARFLNALVDLALFLLILFFLLKDGAGLREEFRRVSPFSENQEALIFGHISRTVKGVLQAMVVVPIAQGILAGVGFWFFGLPSPLVWGVVVVFAALVPILGSPLGWVPAAAYLYREGSTRGALGLALYGVVVISGVDNVVKPLILQGAAQIHPLLGFLSIVGGIFAFGPLGFLVGPVVLSLVISAIRIYRDDVLARRLGASLTPQEPRT